MPAFIHTIEVDGESTYKKMGYIKPHHRLYNFVKKHQHKDEVKFSFSNQRINGEGGTEGRKGREGGREEGRERGEGEEEEGEEELGS